jgi:hypothetical protein
MLSLLLRHASNRSGKERIESVHQNCSYCAQHRISLVLGLFTFSSARLRLLSAIARCGVPRNSHQNNAAPQWRKEMLYSTECQGLAVKFRHLEFKLIHVQQHDDALAIANQWSLEGTVTRRERQVIMDRQPNLTHRPALAALLLGHYALKAEVPGYRTPPIGGKYLYRVAKIL